MFLASPRSFSKAGAASADASDILDVERRNALAAPVIDDQPARYVERVLALAQQQFAKIGAHGATGDGLDARSLGGGERQADVIAAGAIAIDDAVGRAHADRCRKPSTMLGRSKRSLRREAARPRTPGCQPSPATTMAGLLRAAPRAASASRKAWSSTLISMAWRSRLSLSSSAAMIEQRPLSWLVN